MPGPDQYSGKPVKWRYLWDNSKLSLYQRCPKFTGEKACWVLLGPDFICPFIAIYRGLHFTCFTILALMRLCTTVNIMRLCTTVSEFEAHITRVPMVFLLICWTVCSSSPPHRTRRKRFNRSSKSGLHPSRRIVKFIGLILWLQKCTVCALVRKKMCARISDHCLLWIDGAHSSVRKCVRE
jgi:hypothetical protein